MYYIKTYKHLLGSPNIVVCLDAGAATPDSMTLTTTLRGYVDFELKVKVGTNNMHSGVAGGIAPNPLQVMMVLLQRIQNFGT